MNPPLFSQRWNTACGIATLAHEGQVRSGTKLPYITHPFAVATLVERFGGDEDQRLAAVLHDTLEDGKEGPRHYTDNIRSLLGPEVLRLVQVCTDLDAEGPTREAWRQLDKPAKAAVWRARKERYAAHLRDLSAYDALIPMCDKLHNAQSLNQDLEIQGLKSLRRFVGGQEGVLWYYTALADAFLSHQTPASQALSAEVAELTSRVTKLELLENQPHPKPKP